MGEIRKNGNHFNKPEDRPILLHRRCIFLMVVSVLSDEFRRNLFTSYLQAFFTLLLRHHKIETIHLYVVSFREIYYRLFTCMCEDENRVMQ